MRIALDESKFESCAFVKTSCVEFDQQKSATRPKSCGCTAPLDVSNFECNFCNKPSEIEEEYSKCPMKCLQKNCKDEENEHKKLCKDSLEDLKKRYKKSLANYCEDSNETRTKHYCSDSLEDLIKRYEELSSKNVCSCKDKIEDNFCKDSLTEIHKRRQNHCCCCCTELQNQKVNYCSKDFNVAPCRCSSCSSDIPIPGPGLQLFKKWFEKQSCCRRLNLKCDPPYSKPKKYATKDYISDLPLNYRKVYNLDCEV